MNQAHSKTESSPGRPTDEAKRRKVIEVARNLFMQHGFQSVSLGRIAREAGVSRTTIYNQFVDKQGLLAEIADDTTHLVAPDLMSAEELGDRPIGDVLVRVGRSLMEYLEQDLVLHAHRTLALEAERQPEFARTFFEYGPLRVRKALSELLSEAVSQDQLKIDDTDEAARFLISLWKGEYYMELQFNVTDPRSDDERADHVEKTTALFLRAYRPEND